MEESNILNKNNKKKILIGSIIIVLVLLLVVVGSTYAYFSMRINGEGTSTKVTITTGSSNQIKLSGGLEDFHIKLDVKDMAYNRIDWEYYATSDSKLPYVTNKEEGLTEIGKVEVTGDLEERHVCTASVKVTLDGSMATLIQKGDLELYLESEQYTNKSDLTEIDSNYPAELEFVLENTKPIEDKSIKAYLKFTNRDKEQNYLAGKTLNVDIIIEDFKCTTDTEAPQIDKIYFNEDTSEQHYTNVLNNTLHMSWLDEDVKEYCITKEEDTTNCIWKPTNGQQSIEEPIQLEDIEKDHLYNGYLKDNAGNISIKGTASIIYDKTLPTINSFYIKEEGTAKYTNQVKNKVYITYNDNNIKDMCVTEETTSTNCQWTTISESMDYTFANNTEGTKTIYGYVRDKAGNISSANMTSSIIYDVTPPTITSVTATNTQETSLTINITANDNKEGVSQTSGIFQYCYSRSNSTRETDYTCGGSASITISGLQAGTSYDFYIYAKDNAGNGSSTNKVHYSFKTKAKIASDYLEDYDTGTTGVKTLQSTPFGGLYRYVGTTTDVTNNYICFGTTDSNACKTNPDKYMYRIIGVTDGSKINTDLGLVEGQLKIIKTIPLSETKAWTDSHYEVAWDKSELKNYLNDDFLSDAKINQWQNGTYWDELISNHKWYLETYAAARKWPSTNPSPNSISVGLTEGKVALMYASDYYNSGNQDLNNWLYIKNGWRTNSSLSGDFVCEYSMTQWNDNYYGGWYTNTEGVLVANYRNGEKALAVRPVFYLIPNITLSGEGTEGNPFIIQ